MITEKQLIQDCQQGRKESQFLLVKRYSGMLMTTCRRYARDEAMAKDVLQETLIRIFGNISKYRPIGSFEAWMRRIAVRCSLQWLEKSHFRRESPTEKFDKDQMMEPAIYNQLATENIIKAVQELPDGFRTVFNLNVIEGYSHKEIAELLNITESSSRSQLLRARRLLQKKLTDSQKVRSI